MNIWHGTDSFNDISSDSVIISAGPHHGDATWVTVYFDCIKEKFPDSQLILLTYQPLLDIFAHQESVAGAVIIDEPFTLTKSSIRASEFNKFKAVIPPIAHYPIPHRYNIGRYSIYLKGRGYNVPDDLRPDLKYSQAEIDEFDVFISQYSGPKFMLELFCYSAQSAFNMPCFQRLIKYLETRFPTAWFLVPCSPKESLKLPRNPRIISLSQFSVRQSGYFLNYCDIMFGVGSGIGNACAGRAIKQDVLWFESLTNQWHSTLPYGDNRISYVGEAYDEYLTLIKSELNKKYGTPSHIL